MCVVWDAGISDLGEYLAKATGREVSPLKNYRHHCIIHTKPTDPETEDEKPTIFIAGNAKDMYVTVYVNPVDSAKESIVVGRSDIRNPKSWPRIRRLIDEAVEKHS